MLLQMESAHHPGCLYDVLCTCDFPFIIGLQYSFQNDRFLFLLLDLAEAGDLKQKMKANKGTYSYLFI